MTIPVRPRSGPVNLHFTLAFLFGAVAWWAWPAAGDWWQWWVLWLLFAFGSFTATVSALGGLVQDYRLRRRLFLSQIASDDHGSARAATSEEIAARGINNSTFGDLIGLDDAGALLWAPHDIPFRLFIASPGFGKTVGWVIGIILHRAMCGYSLLVPDVKATLAFMLAPALRKLGFEVWVINPARQHLDSIGDVEINLYQSLLDALYADDDRRRDAVKIAADYAAIHYPATSDEKNPYFGHGSRRKFGAIVLALGLFDPARCTPSDVYVHLADRKKFNKLMARAVKLEGIDADDPVAEALRAEASNQLHIATALTENDASFAEGIAQRMLSFSPGGRLGGYGRNATCSIADIRKRQVIVFILTPLSHLREFEAFTSLLNHSVIAACKAAPDGHPVHIVGEEALAYHWPEIASDMETLREIRLSVDLFVQSLSGLIKRHGRATADAILSYCDLRALGGINRYDEAKLLSDMLAEATVRKQDFSYQADAREVGISSRELGRRMMTTDEILAMPKNQVWAFIRGMRPVRISMIHYGQIKPWCEWVGPSPITGTRLPSDPLFEIHYPKEKRNA